MSEPQEEHFALFQTIFHIAAKDVLSLKIQTSYFPS